MLAWLRSRRDRRRTARELYGSIVTQARNRCFYADWGIPDSTQGRFEMIVLHLALALQRFEAAGQAGRRMARAISETFVIDMDDSMREMTFGDLAVPREIKRVVAALVDRHRAYTTALAAPENGPLQAVLETQMGYLREPGRLDVTSLAQYIRDAAAALARQSDAQVLSGHVDWPHRGGEMK